MKSDEEANISTAGCVSEDPNLVPIGRMPYRNFLICVYRKTGGESALFYYEPVVLFDPKTVVQNGDEVSFTVDLWNRTVQNRAVKFLREEVGEADLKSHQVSVMPYEEVRLVKISNEGYITLPESPKLYRNLSESLDFELKCEAESTTVDAKYLSKHFALEFRSPASGKRRGSGSGITHCNVFELNAIKDDHYDDDDHDKDRGIAYKEMYQLNQLNLK